VPGGIFSVSLHQISALVSASGFAHIAPNDKTLDRQAYHRYSFLSLFAVQHPTPTVDDSSGMANDFTSPVLFSDSD
jgi:hypothetical protein